MKKTMTIFVVLLTLLLTEVVFAQEAMAPLNPDFLEYIQGVERAGAQIMTLDAHPLGFIPAPLDLSHLTGLPIFQVHELVALPSSYDLRTQTPAKLTPVKNQGSCGDCWAFATYGSLESNLLPLETWDFSENNLKNTHGFDWGPCFWGNGLMSTAYLARWSGPINETDDPYNPSSNISPSGLTVRKHVQEVLIIPDRANSSDNSNIKQAVMSYGAIMTGMCWNESHYSSTYYAYYYNGTSSCPGTNPPNSTNHAVDIVGWDDNFPASRFPSRPPGDGAFIIRNSWGTSWGENGYFYVSYYDSIIGKYNSVFDNGESVWNYKQVYQYDPLGWISSVGGYGNNTAWFANVFTATSNDPLAAVSFYTASVNSTYSLYLYTNVTSIPTSGSPSSKSDGTIQFPGYHTIDLNTPVPVASGEHFSVVVKLTTPGYDYPVPIEVPISGYSSRATANPGESYISGDGSNWTDLTSLSWCTECNVCLKAFTAPPPEVVSTPTPPSGPTTGVIGKNYAYSTGGSSSSLGNPVEYQFDWKGDGSDLSNWGSATESKTWTTAGIYNVRARAQSTTNVSVVSGWSNSLIVNISLPKIAITPTAYDFGSVKVKKSKTVSCVVQNSGTANLTISTSIKGTDASMFTTSGGGSKAIKPGKSLTIKVAFKPTSTGSKSATLEITSNDPVSPTVDIPLSGTGQ